jgi:hypothetical protein
VVEAMSNIVRLNETAPKDQWIIMSNQGTDCFLELLILSADALHQTEHQEALVSFLKDQKDINAIAPGIAGFDLVEMPWKEGTLKEDLDFLLRVTANAESERIFGELPYEANRDVVLPWLKQFEQLIRQMIMETE